ncbi:unnamed protein product [Kuraishia capsulata CBS 1993]|uniref:Nucleosome assembly protein n=1 Tax=Kuraishia capsulata CBS 1993 TaxID=1382522 RepID=W6MUP2_9ASCO|nr:uncharacterized protein KUCA_T00005435001 [Kuraishia capsulata CBS 1993]CDK29447.1 unnamed protein product [Kuraishia capsulata CBS 1993]
MTEPIKTRLGEMSQAPTPQNTPASVTGSYLKNNPPPTIPSTINEENNEDLHKQLMSNPLLLSMIQNKLGSLVGKDSGYVENLPKSIKQRIHGLKSVQQKQFKIEAEFQSELLELEKKFHKKYEPLFKRRQDIIIGIAEPSAEEIEEGEALLKDDEDKEEAEEKIEEVKEEDEESKEEDEEDIGDDVKGIPNFWLTALGNMTPVSEIISDRDAEVLYNLINVRMEYLDTPGFKLIFEFSENEFFANKYLTKSYYYQSELGYSGDFIYDHAEGCAIKWKDNDHNVTVHIERRKQRNKHTKQVRTIEKVVPTDSFFNFFDPPKAPKSKAEDEDSPDVEGAEAEDSDAEEEDDDLEERLEMDYQLGELMKDKLIPRAVDWFTGEALQYEIGDADEFEEEDYDSFDSEEDDDEDSDDDDDDEDENAKPKSQPAECKQT